MGGRTETSSNNELPMMATREMCEPTCVLGVLCFFSARRPPHESIIRQSADDFPSSCAHQSLRYTRLTSAMFPSGSSQVFFSSVSSSRASVVCCENDDVALLPGARISSPCRPAHEIRATILLPSWDSWVCSLWSFFTTLIDERHRPLCLPVRSFGVVPRVVHLVGRFV